MNYSRFGKSYCTLKNRQDLSSYLKNADGRTPCPPTVLPRNTFTAILVDFEVDIIRQIVVDEVSELSVARD